MLILLCALAVALPLALKGNSCGHDFDFHIESWLSVARHWQQGTLYPHWLEAANYGAGEARLVFYPPATWTLGALLGLLLPWAATPAAFTLVVLAACGLSMQQLAREWLPAPAATVAACAYILSPYTLFVAYERTAYGELAAGIWLPLILLYALRLNRTPASSPGTRASREANAGVPRRASETWVSFSQTTSPASTIPLSLAIAAIWLTNAPAAVIACYLLAAVTLWQAITRRSIRPILQNTSSLLFGLGLAAFYLVPAAWERRWVDIHRAIGPGMRIADSYLFAHTGEAFHDQVLKTASWLVVTMLAATAIASVAAWRQRRRILLPLLVASAAVLVLQLPSTGPVWTHAPELKFLQFPWRLTLILSIAFAIAIGAALSRLKSLRLQAAIVLIAAIAIIPIATKLFWQPCDEEDIVSAQVTVFQSGNGIEGTDEYTTLGADNSIVQQYLPPVRVLKTADAETAHPASSPDQDPGNPTYTAETHQELPAKVNIDQWRPEHKLLTIQSPAAGYAVLRLMDYPAWQVTANHILLTGRPRRDDGLLVVPLQPGLAQIEIRYAATTDVLIGRSLTAASFLAVLLLAAAARKTRRGQLS